MISRALTYLQGAPVVGHGQVVRRDCQSPRLQWNGAPRGGAMRPVTDLKRRVAPFEVVTEMTLPGR